MQARRNAHFDGKRFVNPTGPQPQPFSAVPRLFIERRTPWPSRLDLTPREPLPLEGAPAVITFVGRETLQASSSADWPVVATPAHHFSARTPFDRNRALWGGFTVEAGGRRIYFAGDTAYAPFLRDIPRQIGAIDLALLPIGAYEPRWFMTAVHMNPAAVSSIGMHFGTFQLTTEGIDEPLLALDRALVARRVPPDAFRTLDFGASIRLD